MKQLTIDYDLYLKELQEQRQRGYRDGLRNAKHVCKSIMVDVEPSSLDIDEEELMSFAMELKKFQDLREKEKK